MFVLELMESFLDLSEVSTVMGEQGVAEEVLLSPIEAFRMVRIQSLQ